MSLLLYVLMVIYEKNSCQAFLFMLPSLKVESLGKYAEDLASRALKSEGHTLIVRNFKTRTGEIDILSQKDGIIYVSEVKKRTYFEESIIKRSQIERIWFVFEEFLEKYPHYQEFEATMQVILVANNIITIHEIL